MKDFDGTPIVLSGKDVDDVLAQMTSGNQMDLPSMNDEIFHSIMQYANNMLSYQQLLIVQVYLENINTDISRKYLKAIGLLAEIEKQHNQEVPHGR